MSSNLLQSTYEAPRLRPESTAYFWAVNFVVGLSGLMFGLDSAVISGGIDLIKIQFALNPDQEGWVVSSAMVGCIAGVVCAGSFSDRFGRKPALILVGLLFSVSLIGSALATDYMSLSLMRLLGGLGIGFSSVVSPMFLSEIAPSHSRGRMVSIYQLAITVGILLAFLSNALIVHYGGKASASEVTGWVGHLFVSEQWRGMFAACAVPSVLYTAAAFLLPESPRWLIKQGREALAHGHLTRFFGISDADREAAKIKSSLIGADGNVSLTALIGNSALRRPLAIGCILSAVGALSGINVIMYYSPKIFQSAGLGGNSAHTATVIVGIFNAVFTMIALLGVDRFGRRPLLLLGVSGVLVALISAGAMFYFKIENPWWILPPLLLHVAFFAFSYGPIGWIIISEIFPTRFRGRASSICIFCGWTSGFLLTQAFPRFLASFGGAGVFWICAAATFFALIFIWVAVPETKGKSLEEIELFWKGKNP
ncbi:MAG: sugar porter family MFS transporter [Undibacterium sp.]|nr:sugar porter family MFS transporter [Opitutaceae bacterium]